jgi:hypothetical protein
VRDVRRWKDEVEMEDKERDHDFELSEKLLKLTWELRGT